MLTRGKFYIDYLQQRRNLAVGYNRIANLLAKGLVFEHFRGSAIYGSFVSPQRLTREAHAVLQRALIEPCAPFDMNEPGVRQCIREGWLQSLATDDSEQKFVFVYPTGLHAKYGGALHTALTSAS